MARIWCRRWGHHLCGDPRQVVESFANGDELPLNGSTDQPAMTRSTGVPRLSAETLRRFWTMLAHGQGSLLNAAELGRALGVDG